MALIYNPPPGWDVPLDLEGNPDPDFVPDPAWPEAPAGWQFWRLEASSDMEQGEAENPKASKPQNVAQDREEPSAHLQFEPTPSDSETGLDGIDQGELLVLEDAILLQRAGVYEYHHPLQDSPQYESAISEIQQEMRSILRNNQAILVGDAFSFEGSFAKGQKLVKDLAQLCIRAFNSEVDISMRTMKAGSLDLAIGRLKKSREAIERFGAAMGLSISKEYFELRVKELELVSDLANKKKEEREQEREERAKLREEARVQRELEEKSRELRKERDRLLSVKSRLEEQGDEKQIGEILRNLEEIEGAIEQNDYRAANIRAGYVYVVSNIGSFGEDVVKIGLTRRLEPEERIKELSDASVPFVFDKHLIYFSDDAVGLEADLHAVFDKRRVNLANPRKEFFRVTPQEVQEELEKRVGTLLEFVRKPEADEYYQSQKSL